MQSTDMIDNLFQCSYGKPAMNKPSVGAKQLVKAQSRELDHILRQMSDHTTFVKSRHWMWWVFPLATIGSNDQYQSCIKTCSDLSYVTSFSANVRKWAKILDFVRKAIMYHFKKRTKTTTFESLLSTVFPCELDVNRLLLWVSRSIERKKSRTYGHSECDLQKQTVYFKSQNRLVSTITKIAVHYKHGSINSGQSPQRHAKFINY